MEELEKDIFEISFLMYMKEKQFKYFSMKTVYSIPQNTARYFEKNLNKLVPGVHEKTTYI